MPRYFFNIVDGTSDDDDRGTTFADDKAAFRGAVRFAGLALASGPHLLTDTMHLSVEVVNDSGQLVSVLDFLAERPPSPSETEDNPVGTSSTTGPRFE